jgi:nitrate reductase assembly molybdenum cofactor insertion protein NarJ
MVEAATDEEVLKTMTQIVTAMINFVAQAQQMYSVMAAVVQRFGEDLNATMDKVAKQWALIFERADRPEMVAEFNRFVGQRRGRG